MSVDPEAQAGKIEASDDISPQNLDRSVKKSDIDALLAAEKRETRGKFDATKEKINSNVQNLDRSVKKNIEESKIQIQTLLGDLDGFDNFDAWRKDSDQVKLFQKILELSGIKLSKYGIDGDYGRRRANADGSYREGETMTATRQLCRALGVESDYRPSAKLLTVLTKLVTKPAEKSVAASKDTERQGLNPHRNDEWLNNDYIMNKIGNLGVKVENGKLNMSAMQQSEGPAWQGLDNLTIQNISTDSNDIITIAALSNAGQKIVYRFQKKPAEAVVASTPKAEEELRSIPTPKTEEVKPEPLLTEIEKEDPLLAGLDDVYLDEVGGVDGVGVNKNLDDVVVEPIKTPKETVVEKPKFHKLEIDGNRLSISTKEWKPGFAEQIVQSGILKETGANELVQSIGDREGNRIVIQDGKIIQIESLSFTKIPDDFSGTSLHKLIMPNAFGNLDKINPKIVKLEFGGNITDLSRLQSKALKLHDQKSNREFKINNPNESLPGEAIFIKAGNIMWKAYINKYEENNIFGILANKIASKKIFETPEKYYTSKTKPRRLAGFQNIPDPFKNDVPDLARPKEKEPSVSMTQELKESITGNEDSPNFRIRTNPKTGNAEIIKNKSAPKKPKLKQLQDLPETKEYKEKIKQYKKNHGLDFKDT